MKRVLFIDRDGTLIKEPETDFQVDSLEKLEFIPGVFRNMHKIANQLDYELVIVSNQDGLGTDSFPYKNFDLPHQKFLTAFANEGVFFDDIFVDPSLPEENSPNRKPGIGMLRKFIEGDYDLANSIVIGDRLTDLKLAKNLSAKAVYFNNETYSSDVVNAELSDVCVLVSNNWDEVYKKLLKLSRSVNLQRFTSETKIRISLNLDGSGQGNISTGIGFFDHMLEQIKRHSGIDLDIECDGDIDVDEHHTIEDTALILGEAFKKALGNKAGINRYGFLLPMDDSLAQVAIDFGGRNWLVWEVDFKREKVGEVPTEMFYHFFKSFSDKAECNLNIKAEGSNEHHKIEAIFKAFAKAIKMAVQQNVNDDSVPSTKGSL
jgi:imidazoleglycerol-phosphate dehydratase / histidinol-phosphatase